MWKFRHWLVFKINIAEILNVGEGKKKREKTMKKLSFH